MRPLEERFPTLYHNISHEVPAGGGEAEEVRTPRETAPTLHEVIQRVLAHHRVNDAVLPGDLTASVQEFLGHAEPAAAPAPVEKRKSQRKPKVKQPAAAPAGTDG